MEIKNKCVSQLPMTTCTSMHRGCQFQPTSAVNAVQLTRSNTDTRGWLAR